MSDQLLLWLTNNIIPAIALGILFWLGRTASRISEKTIAFETDLKLAVSTFSQQAQRTNEHIESILKKMEKLDEHQDKIIRIEEREKHRDDKLTYIVKWREEHDKLHITHS